MCCEILYTKVKERKSSSSFKFAIIRSKAYLYGSAKGYLLPPIMGKFNFKGDHFKCERQHDFKHTNSHFMSQPKSAAIMWTIEEAPERRAGDATWKRKGFSPPNICYSRGSLWDPPQSRRSAALLQHQMISPWRARAGHIWTHVNTTRPIQFSLNFYYRNWMFSMKLACAWGNFNSEQNVREIWTLKLVLRLKRLDLRTGV